MSGSMSGPKNRPKNWQETMKATADATLAERTATPARNVADASFHWNAYDVWLSRVQPPRDIPARISMTDPVMRHRQGTAARD